MGRILYRCECNKPLVVDEGNTFAVHFCHWRINKTSGRVTARCPRCPKEHEIQKGTPAMDQALLCMSVMSVTVEKQATV